MRSPGTRRDATDPLADAARGAYRNGSLRLGGGMPLLLCDRLIAGMRDPIRRAVISACCAMTVPALGATQGLPPLRTLTEPEAVATTVSRDTRVRGVTGGSAVVSDFGRRRVVLLDPALRIVATIVDSATIHGPGLDDALPSATIIPLRGDSTGYVNVATGSLLVIAPDGRVGRQIALPRGDVFNFAGRSWMGTPKGDASGRIVYRGNRPRTAGVSAPAGSEPLIRADFSRMVLDTLAWLRVDPMVGPMRSTGGAARQGPILTAHLDSWGALSDGTVAIVRADDYRIDWLDVGGGRRATPPMPAQGRQLTPEDKQRMADSVRDAWNALARTGAAVPSSFAPPTAADIGDLLAPFHPRDVWTDADDRIWVRPVSSYRAGGAAEYDVIDRRGAVVARVQLPADRALVGFGPGGAVYVSATSGSARLERRRIVVP